MGTVVRLLLPKILKEVVKLIKPLEQYVHEENDLDREVYRINIEMSKLQARLDALQELLLETQSDVVLLQKTKTTKRKPRKR